jgi:hypothetical protein
MKMTTDIPPSLVTPNTVETRIGTLKFTDGFPDDGTAAKVYDSLDFQRGLHKSLFLTANTTTPYTLLYLSTKDGPLVVEVPPEVLGPIDDAWFRWVTDVGITGPDKGKGGNVRAR